MAELDLEHRISQRTPEVTFGSVRPQQKKHANLVLGVVAACAGLVLVAMVAMMVRSRGESAAANPGWESGVDSVKTDLPSAPIPEAVLDAEEPEAEEQARSEAQPEGQPADLPGPAHAASQDSTLPLGSDSSPAVSRPDVSRSAPATSSRPTKPANAAQTSRAVERAKATRRPSDHPPSAGFPEP